MAEPLTAKSQPLSATLQTQVLSLLMFSSEYFRMVRNSIELDSWTGDRSIHMLVDNLYRYIDTYKEPAADAAYLIASEMQLEPDQAENLQHLIQNCEINYEQLNKEYVISQLEKFQRRATYQDALFKACEAWEKDDLDKVEELFLQAPKNRQKLFEPGLRLSDILKLLHKTDEERSEDHIPLFIEPLDIRGLNPRRKELLLFVGPPKAGKCLGRDTGILMHDGSVKMAQDVQVGDQVMGPDSLPRNVLGTNRGVDQMFLVESRNGSFTCNSEHVLSLKTSGIRFGSHTNPRYSTGVTQNIKISEYVNYSKAKKNQLKLWHPECITFGHYFTPLPLEPYFLGLWLGDGNANN